MRLKNKCKQIILLSNFNLHSNFIFQLLRHLASKSTVIDRLYGEKMKKKKKPSGQEWKERKMSDELNYNYNYIRALCNVVMTCFG